MKLILRETVETLGEQGEVVDVKPGYARNYLIPQGLAYAATEGNLRRIEEEKQRAQERAKRDYLESKRRASQLDTLALTFAVRAGAEGKLFGSVTNADIAQRINDQGFDFEFDRRWIDLEEPIKLLGSYKIPVRLHAEVEVEIEVSVVAGEGDS